MASFTLSIILLVMFCGLLTAREITDYYLRKTFFIFIFSLLIQIAMSVTSFVNLATKDKDV